MSHDIAANRSHFVSDLDSTSMLVTSTRCLLQAPLASEWGSAPLGVIATVLDLGASEPALAACRPDWTATQNVSVHATGWLVRGPIVVDSRLVRTGKKLIVVAARIYDGQGIEDFEALKLATESASVLDRLTLVARGLVTFARIPGAAASGMDAYDPRLRIGNAYRRTFAEPPAGTLYGRMGLRIVDPARGVVELDSRPYVANSIGTINGGAIAVLLQAAAEAMRPGLVATDVQIHYLSQLKSGPARTAGVVSRDAPDHTVIALNVVDAGDGDQVLVLATVTLQRPDTPVRTG